MSPCESKRNSSPVFNVIVPGGKAIRATPSLRVISWLSDRNWQPSLRLASALLYNDSCCLQFVVGATRYAATARTMD